MSEFVEKASEQNSAVQRSRICAKSRGRSSSPLPHAAPKLKTDPEIAKLESLDNTLSYATPALKTDREIEPPWESLDDTLSHATPELKTDREIEPLESLEDTLSYATPELNMDREIEPEAYVEPIWTTVAGCGEKLRNTKPKSLGWRRWITTLRRNSACFLRHSV